MKTFVTAALLATMSATVLTDASPALRMGTNATTAGPKHAIQGKAYDVWMSTAVWLDGRNVDVLKLLNGLECVHTCEARNECFGAVFTAFDNNCYLKPYDTLLAPGFLPPVVPQYLNLSSYMLIPLDFHAQYKPPFYKFFPNCDLEGRDYVNRPGADIHDCMRKCYHEFFYEHEECTASWSNYNGGTCWFKIINTAADQPSCTDKAGVETAFLFDLVIV